MVCVNSRDQVRSGAQPPGDDGATTSPGREVLAGLRLSLAAGLGLFPLGIAFGMLVVQAGLPWWVAPALSVAAFAGSLELLMVGLLAGGTPLATIALTTVLVNFRHVFYAFSFPLRAVGNRFARVYSVYAMIDEAYAVTATNPAGWTGRRLVSLQLAFQAYWVCGGLLGVAFASALPAPVAGLEFALCALFVTLTLDAARSSAQVPSLLLAAVSFAVAVVAVPDSVLFVALTIFVGLLVLRFLAQRYWGHVGTHDDANHAVSPEAERA